MTDEKIEYIDPKLLKPDPHQPRKEFDKEFIKNLASTYDTQGVIEPLEVDENNIIILGEQRWKGALDKGLKKVPILRKTGLTRKARLERQLIDDAHRKELNEMEKAWAYGTAIININTGKNYTIEDVKKMKRQMQLNLIALDKKGKWGQPEGGCAELSRIIGVPQPTIWNYVQCLYLEPETQTMIGNEKGQIPYTYARVVARLYPDHKEKQAEVEQLLRDGEFSTREDLEETIDNYFKTLEKEAEKRAAELPPPKPKPPEIKPSKEEIEEKAKKKAKEKLSDLEKAQKTLEDVQKKIKNAEQLGIDVSKYEKQLRLAYNLITRKEFLNPKLAWEEGRKLKKNLDDTIREAKKTEEEKKREEKIRKQAEEETKRKLMADEEFKKKMLEEEKERLRKVQEEAEKERIKKMAKALPQLTPEEKARLEKFLSEQLKWIDEKLKDPDIQARGELFMDWIAHSVIIQYLDKTFCPHCGIEKSGELQWSCCERNVDDSYKELIRRLSKTKGDN